MKKLTVEHAEAVSTAKLNLIRLCERDTHPKFKAEVEKRIVRLNEVYWWILNGIFHPELPFGEEPETPDKHKPEEPDDHGSKDAG